MMMKYRVFPFTALIGLDELKLGLLLNGINPGIGGILIRGEKGTAKSTAVRGLASLLPEIEVVAGCRFSCDPAVPEEFCSDCSRDLTGKRTTHRKIELIDLPLNATEDRVAGGIDFSQAIQRGQSVLQPGLLGDANRSMLYVDEVNLLDDHIVDLILDAASSGRNIIEREGISFQHPARLILIGTMNPEEGDLRPQLLDRFGLCVEVKASHDLDERVELLLRREAFDEDPETFTNSYSRETTKLRQRLAKARELLPKVHVPPQLRTFISELCIKNSVAGHRADLVMEQAAKALAAFEGTVKVTSEHIGRISSMVLRHRLREAEAPPPPPPPPPPEDESQDEEQEQQEQQEQEQQEQQEQQQEQEQEQPEQQPQQEQPPESIDENSNSQDDTQEMDQEDALHGGGDIVFEIGEPFKVKKISTAKDRLARRGSGRRSRSRISQKQGRYIKAANLGGKRNNDIALDATIRAAAPFQKSRSQENSGQNGQLAVHLLPSDVRVKVREKRIGNLLLFVVDGSGSMGARGRMTASKSAIMSLLLDAYQKRDKVGMISFRRREAVVNLPITNSVEMAGRLLAEMPVGGRTPLSAGLIKGYETIRNYLIREPAGKPIVILLTDGKSNVSLSEDNPVDEMLRLATVLAQESRTKYIVVDTEEEGLVTFALAKRLAANLGADYFKTKELQAEELVKIVREQQ